MQALWLRSFQTWPLLTTMEWWQKWALKKSRLPRLSLQRMVTAAKGMMTMTMTWMRSKSVNRLIRIIFSLSSTLLILPREIHTLSMAKIFNFPPWNNRLIKTNSKWANTFLRRRSMRMQNFSSLASCRQLILQMWLSKTLFGNLKVKALQS